MQPHSYKEPVLPQLGSIAEIESALCYAQEVKVSNVNTSIDLALRCKQSSEELCYELGIAKSSCQLGLYYMIMGRHQEANDYSNTAEELFHKYNDHAGLAEVLYIKGSIAYKSAKHHIGLDYLYKSLRLQENLEDKKGQSRTLKAIGYIYETFEETDKAEETYLKCRQLSQEIGDKNGESNACNPLSGIYLKKGDVVNATDTIERSITLKKQTGDKRGLAYAFFGKGKICLSLEDFDYAQDLFIKALRIHEFVGDKLGMCMCYSKLGNLHYQKGDLDLSMDFFHKSIELGQLNDNFEILYISYFYLYLISKKEDRVEDALHYHELYHSCKSEVVNKGTRNYIRSLESGWRMDSLEMEALNQRKRLEFTERKNQELNRFVSRVSHDLKGPLSSMIALHEIVEKEIEDESSLYYFNMYNKGLKRLNETIHDLLELSRLKSLEIERVSIDLKGIVDQCLDSFSYFPNFEDIKFSISIEGGIEIKSDKRLLKTIVQNLLENSIKYADNSKGECKVAVTAKSVAEDYMALIVEDNGVGIEETYQDRIFDMFYRANDTVNGSGLGLFILKTAVDKLDGKVEMKSQLGHGTKMTILLPF